MSPRRRAPRGRKPIRVFYSPLSGRFYASEHYRVGPDGVVVITGKKYDVTNDIGYAIDQHDLEFTKVTSTASALREESHES